MGKDELFLHDCQIMWRFGAMVSGQDDWRHQLNLLAQAIDGANGPNGGGYEYYFGQGVDGEWAARKAKEAENA